MHEFQVCWKLLGGTFALCAFFFHDEFLYIILMKRAILGHLYEKTKQRTEP